MKKTKLRIEELDLLTLKPVEDDSLVFKEVEIDERIAQLFLSMCPVWEKLQDILYKEIEK